MVIFGGSIYQVRRALHALGIGWDFLVFDFVSPSLWTEAPCGGPLFLSEKSRSLGKIAPGIYFLGLRKVISGFGIR